MTIGKDLSHIENATIEDVKAFFFKHYCPANAVLVVAGKVKRDDVKKLAEKWFGPIPSGIKYNRNTPKEPQQTEARFLAIKADVPLDAYIKTWHMDARLQKGYYVADIITEILGGGGSSRLYQSLVKEQKIFSNLDCYHFGTIEAGLLAVEGKLVKGVKMEDAEKAVNEELQKFIDEPATEIELTKAKNKTESVIAFEDMSVMSRAGSLALYEILGDADLINTELSRYNAITLEDVKEYSKTILNPASVLIIHALC